MLLMQFGPCFREHATVAREEDEIRTFAVSRQLKLRCRQLIGLFCSILSTSLLQAFTTLRGKSVAYVAG
jgi:hypothetical protein